MGTLPSAGTVIGDGFVLEELIGHGGMGAVFRAKDKKGSVVALKMLLKGQAEDPQLWQEAAKRLRDEARATAKVENPALVKVLAWGDDNKFGPYVALEFLIGASLRERLSGPAGALGWRNVSTKVARPLLQALAALHEVNVVHRDIKPENIFDSGDGSYKLGDLGLAAFEGREAHTKTGATWGTPGYMAPERLATASNPLSKAGDIYSAAVVIVEAVAGRLPFKGRRAGEIIKAQIEQPVRRGHLQAFGFPPQMALVLEQALHKDPQQRPSAKEFLQKLEMAVASSSAIGGQLKATGLQTAAHTKGANKGTITKGVDKSQVRTALSSSASSEGRIATTQRNNNKKSILIALTVLCLCILSALFFIGPFSSTAENKKNDFQSQLVDVSKMELRNPDASLLLHVSDSFNEYVGKLATKKVNIATVVAKISHEQKSKSTFSPLLPLFIARRYKRWTELRKGARELLHKFRESRKDESPSEDGLRTETLLLEMLAMAARAENEIEDELIASAQSLDEHFFDDKEKFIRQQLRLLFIRALACFRAAQNLKNDDFSKYKHALKTYEDMVPALQVASNHPYFSKKEQTHLKALLKPHLANNQKSENLNESYEKLCRELFDFAKNALKEGTDAKDNLRRFSLDEKKLGESVLLGTKRQKRPKLFKGEAQKCISHFRRGYWALVVASLSPNTHPEAIYNLLAIGPALHVAHRSTGPIETPLNKYGWGAGIEKGQPWRLAIYAAKQQWPNFMQKTNEQISILEQDPMLKGYLDFIDTAASREISTSGKKINQRFERLLINQPLVQPAQGLLLGRIYLNGDRKKECVEAITSALRYLATALPEKEAWLAYSNVHRAAFKILARMAQGDKVLSYHRNLRKLAMLCERQTENKTIANHLRIVGLIYECNVTIRKASHSDYLWENWKLEQRLEKLQEINPDYLKLTKELESIPISGIDILEPLSSEQRRVIEGRAAVGLEP